MPEVTFEYAFKALTENQPLSWQKRLFSERVMGKGEFPSVIDLPTGLGKTMVMAIWLIARAKKLDVPTRLIYVVDRRTVVDQATDLAKTLVKNWNETKIFEGCAPAISTLRGQLADNREWSTDPSRPAIIIGTVDLIGSALLFSGYRSSYKRRPLEAGLLGQDSLLVLDEAHLSRPFEKLICDIGDGGSFQKVRDNKTSNRPMRIVRMSATSGQSNSDNATFTLQFDKDGNLTGEDAKDTVIADRFSSKKRLAITTLGEKDDLNEEMANAACELARQSHLKGKRIVVFVRSPDDARVIAETIRDYAKLTKSKSNPDPKGPYADSVAVLTGTMRGFERDKLVENDGPVEKPVFKDRWLNGVLHPSDVTNQVPVFLVSTSAGEVGFDLNADHLIGDGNATPLDSWIQRLGRVNRRGMGTAIVQVFVKPPIAKKAKEEVAETHTVTTASVKAIEALNNLPTAEPLDTDNRRGPIFDASPQALRKLYKPDDAMSPTPIMVELTDILIDAWSMTSITERMPGRPDVAPWLRGVAEDMPQTSVVWRSELELLGGEPDAQLKLKTVFSKYRIRAHEMLTTNTSRIVDFLKLATKKRAYLLDTRVALKLTRELRLTTIGHLLDDPGILYAEATLILPSRFGGLDQAGMLSHDAVPLRKLGDPPPPSLDVADQPGYESRENAVSRRRMILRRAGDKWRAMPIDVGESSSVSTHESLGLDDVPQSKLAILNAIRDDLELRPADIIKFDLDDEGDPQQLLLLLNAIRARKNDPVSQSLDEHVSAVESEARRIADNLGLGADHPVRRALLFGAKWHDEGKRSPTWQRFIGGSVDGPLGKSDQYCDPKKLAGYRHEFGSLLRVLHPDPTESREKPDLPGEEGVFELALQLIAVHHGHGRPHFDTPIDRDFHAPRLIDRVHTDSIRRFARLQHEYGWWHLAWLENLLRGADGMASANVNDDENQDDDTEVGE